MENNVDEILKVLSNNKIKNVEILDLTSKSPLMSKIIVGTFSNDKNTRVIANQVKQELERKKKEQDLEKKKIEMDRKKMESEKLQLEFEKKKIEEEKLNFEKQKAHANDNYKINSFNRHKPSRE